MVLKVAKAVKDMEQKVSVMIIVVVIIAIMDVRAYS